MKRGHAAVADRVRSAQQPDFIDEICLQERPGDARAALDHQPRDIARVQRRHDADEIEPRRIPRRQPNDDGAGGAELRRRGGFRCFRSHQPQRRIARRMHQLAVARYPQGTIQHHAHRRLRGHAGETAGQIRIVRDHRADADENGIALRAQQMHARACFFAGDRHRLAGETDLVVARHRQFQDHMRSLVDDAADVAGMIAGGLVAEQPDIDDDAGRAQSRMALPRDIRIGIWHRRHDPRDAGRDHRVGARRRAPDMRTRLQRHIERRALGLRARAAQSFRLGVRTAAVLGPAAPDDDTVLDDDRADRGIRCGPPQPAPTERQSQLHEATIDGLGEAGLVRMLIFQNPEDHLRTTTGFSSFLGSSSPVSSPSSASKSLASRKSR
ncbi:MAG: hypothetical protein JWR79_1628 [Tardiphaga sp.]|nr:hypothetical protein [Tardiphaga sp.]